MHSKSTWAHGIGTDTQFLADVTGDGRADAVVFVKATGDWYVASARTGELS